MRNVITLITLLLLSASAVAQNRHDEQKEMQTLFGNKTGFGGYLGFNMKMTEVNGQDALLTGGELSFAINHSFNIGFEGYGMVNEVRSDNLSDELEPLYMQMGYGGLHLEPVIASESLIHVTLPVLLGAGGVAETVRPIFDHENWDPNIDFQPLYHRSEYFFIAEPGVNLELNVFRFMRFVAGASYRFTTDFDLGVIDRSDINGWNGSLGIRIGWF